MSNNNENGAGPSAADVSQAEKNPPAPEPTAVPQKGNRVVQLLAAVSGLIHTHQSDQEQIANYKKAAQALVDDPESAFSDVEKVQIDQVLAEAAAVSPPTNEQVAAANGTPPVPTVGP